MDIRKIVRLAGWFAGHRENAKESEVEIMARIALAVIVGIILAVLAWHALAHCAAAPAC